MLSVSPTDRIFILAGAGVSAESGIPTLRGVGGLCDIGISVIPDRVALALIDKHAGSPSQELVSLTRR